MELKKYKLGEILDVTRGASLSGEFYATEGKYIRLTCGNFDYQNNCFKENKSKDNLYYIGDFKPEFLMEEGDIITPLTEQAIGLLGSTAIIPESGKYIQSQDVAKIICKEKLLYKDFAFYLISSTLVKQQLSAAAQQTKIRHTSPDKIRDCTVWIPELTAQKRIGKLLRSLDRKIELNRAINQNLEAMVKQLYDYWFVQFDFPNEEGKPYKSSGGEMVWNEKLKRFIPKGWESTTLGNECQMYQPKTLGLSELDESAKYKVYGANGVIGKYHTYNHENSEIAMACRGNSCGTVNRTAPFSWITGNAMVIKMIDDLIHNEYIKQALQYANIDGAISGSGQPQLTRENLNSIKLCKPTRELIICFSEQVSNIIKMYLQNESNIEGLTRQRDELLPLLVNGQITIE
ncbi:restriction endonuclease subunit S [Phocaeicola sp.]|uniref:restriction endonuclease subunit S n=1 Tax=Phocaeicola sp. TaxID=2773926 RepID=UPI002A80005D|nr:restriction endonuclease subunit S [Phocaeicola sp.]